MQYRCFVCAAVISAAMLFGGTADAAVTGSAQDYSLTLGECHGFPGAVDDAADVTLGVVQTRPVGVSTYYNPIGHEVVQRIRPGILHPMPVLRAKYVKAFDEKPDVAKIGLDTVATFPGEAELTDKSKFVIAGDASGTAVLLTLTNVNLPQDKTGEWRLRVHAETLKLEEHVPDAVGDVGRAAISKAPITLPGRLTYGLRRAYQDPVKVMALDLASGAEPREVATGTDCRFALNGTVVDRVDDHTLRLTDAAGKRVGEVRIPGSEIADFNVSADASRVVIATERFVPAKDPNQFDRRELASIVFDTASGNPVGEIIGYDEGCFLPDGRLLMTASNAGAGLFIADPKSGKVTPIKFDRQWDGKSEPDWPRSPSVSPDGRRIAFVSYRDVYVAGIDGKGCVPVWKNEKQEPQAQPTFSPDGKYVAFINVPLNVMTGPGQVMVVDVERHTRQAVEGARDASSYVPLTWGK